MSLSITVKSPNIADYEAICLCIAEARGQNYYTKEHYDPIYLLNGGKYELFAAYDENGEIAGFSGLTSERFCHSRTTLSLLNVRPQYTGKGIATALLEYSMSILRKRGEKVIKGNAVTKHVSIQRVLENLGLMPTGILPGVRAGKNAEPVVNGKCALTVHVCNLAVHGAINLFLHRDIAELGDAIYASLGVDTKITCDSLLPGESIVEYQFDDHDAVLFIRILSCGSGVSGKLRELVDRYRTPSMTAIVLLSLGTPTAIFGYEALCVDGWRFSGFDPLGQFENAIFFSGNAGLADMALSERTMKVYEKLHL